MRLLMQQLELIISHAQGWEEVKKHLATLAKQQWVHPVEQRLNFVRRASFVTDDSVGLQGKVRARRSSHFCINVHLIVLIESVYIYIYMQNGVELSDRVCARVTTVSVCLV